MTSRRLARLVLAGSPVTLHVVCSSDCAQPTTLAKVTLHPAVRARKTLAEEIGVPVEELEIIETEQERCPNSCVGLGEWGEICAQVITLGWRVMLGRRGSDTKRAQTRKGASASLLQAPRIAVSCPCCNVAQRRGSGI